MGFAATTWRCRACRSISSRPIAAIRSSCIQQAIAVFSRHRLGTRIASPVIGTSCAGMRTISNSSCAGRFAARFATKRRPNDNRRNRHDEEPSDAVCQPAPVGVIPIPCLRLPGRRVVALRQTSRSKATGDDAATRDHRDLCCICTYASECMHRGTAGRPKLYCELFDVDVQDVRRRRRRHASSDADGGTLPTPPADCAAIARTASTARSAVAGRRRLAL